MNNHSLPYRRNDDNDLPSRATLREQQVTPITTANRKVALVDIGLYALARGEWLVVRAITHLIQARGWDDE
jgi:hypothetical protein